MSSAKKNATHEPLDKGFSKRMKQYSAAYLAESFLDFYRVRGHTICPSAPLVPDDPTLLFTAAGMVPFKSYYSDPDRAPYRMAASVQKCLRAGGKQSDLENVGRTLRHHTFFEMLGNFSFGDYFKQEAIDTAWELSVDVWKIDPARIWVSVYENDDEAFDLWVKRIGLAKDRVVRLGKKDNFWGPVGDTGVCGPSSELYYDTGETRGCDRDDCGPGCECDRYIEYWNLVFPQFFYSAQGEYDPLPKPGIDTGMGMERVAFILQEVEDNFHTDVFLPIRNAIARALPKKAMGERADLAINVASDHVRALVFALAEGIMPSNEGRGYVLRRLLRRALTKMHPFGVKKPFMADAVDVVIEVMGDRYPDIRQRGGLVRKVITAEEEHFLSTIDQGWSKFEEVIERSTKGKAKRFPGKDAFILYDTFGFPFELTVELAADAGLTVDDTGYAAEMAKQKERSRRHHKAAVDERLRGEPTAGDTVAMEITAVDGTEFLGYDGLVCDAGLGTIAFFGEGQAIEATTDRTVFYPEGGGQVGDTGTAEIGGRRFAVSDAFRREDTIVHRLDWSGASNVDELGSLFRANPTVRLSVDKETRLSTARNHTGTHLLHAALRQVLGDHVAQAGSLVAPDRLRFDFHHFQPMTDDELVRVEDLVNGAIMDDLTVDIKWLPRDQAFAAGAMALFGEKYGETVRVVTINGFSKELCGGTHLRHTGEIGSFVIKHESAVAAGVRRIEALTGWGAVEFLRGVIRDRMQMAHGLRVAPEELGRRVDGLAREVEALRRRVAQSESEQAATSVADAAAGAEDIAGMKLATFEITAGDMAALRAAGDQLRGSLDRGVGLLCLTSGKKPVVLIVVSDALIKAGRLTADTIARGIADDLSFKGGGKKHMAQIGLSHAKDFDKVVSYVKTRLEELS